MQRPATWDLVLMMAVWWYPERRRALEDRLLQRYHRAIEAKGVRGHGLYALRHDYRLALIDQIWVPLSQSASKLEPWIWCGAFERIMLAYEDLGLDEFLEAA